MQPLTHHELIALAAPFVRQGLQVDLPGSDRLQRRLAFRPTELAAEGALPPLKQSLLLELPDAGPARLVRRLTLPDGAVAELACEAEDAATLLAAAQAVPPSRQLPQVAGRPLVLSHRQAVGSRTLQLTRAQVALDGLQLEVTVSRVGGIAAELRLTPAPGRQYQLPEDLLSVLGLAWSRLSPARGGWQCSLQLRGDGAQRSADAEAKLARSVAHLVQTLAEPPARFHERFHRQRWLVTLRRATPLLAALGLIGSALMVPQLELGSGSVVNLLIFNAPPLLLVWLFSMREMPRLEIPPLPRRPALPGWQVPADGPQADRASG